MKKTALIHKAICFASEVHRGQMRKGKEVPYITHPRAVAEILSEVTDDENIIAAGVLHDTIEDCKPYGSITKAVLEKEFNGDVARMVNDVTEQDKTLPWEDRKAAAFSHINDMQHDSLLVKSADILHNLTELTEDLLECGQNVFKKFNAPRARTITRYKNLIAELTRVWPENSLLTDLRKKLKEFLSLCYNEAISRETGRALTQ